MKYGPQTNWRHIANDNSTVHAYKRWPASCKRESMLTKYLHGTATQPNIRPTKYLRGSRVNAALGKSVFD